MPEQVVAADEAWTEFSVGWSLHSTRRAVTQSLHVRGVLRQFDGGLIFESGWPDTSSAASIARWLHPVFPGHPTTDRAVFRLPRRVEWGATQAGQGRRMVLPP